MADNVNTDVLETDELITFTRRVPNPGPMAAVPAQSCGAGLTECGAFRTAVDELLNGARRIHDEASDGIPTIKTLVKQSHDKYLANDAAQAQRIAEKGYMSGAENRSR